jgi:hypothetical protein
MLNGNAKGKLMSLSYWSYKHFMRRISILKNKMKKEKNGRVVVLYIKNNIS